MYGFQPTAAHRLAQLPQQLANGGAVGFGARGLAGLRDMIPKVEAMGYPQAAPAPAPVAAPAPASDPRAAQLMAMIPQMEAMGFKQQPQRLAEGGLVRGPGTGTSDSIPDEAEPGTFIMPADSTEAIGPSALEKMGTVPVRLSDGEFKAPPEQVMALGTAVLKLFKDATHTPVNGVDGGQTDAEAGGAQGFNPADRMAQMPEQMFADGGTVEDERQRRLSQIPTGSNQPAPAPDGSQQNPLNNEVGRNVVNTLSALPGVGGLASRGGATAARAATGGAMSTERAIPAAWEVVQEGGALANRAGTATQQMGQIGTSGGGALTRAANVAQAAPQTALPGSAGQLAPRAAAEVGEAAAGFAPRARTATQWADVVEPAALASPQAAPAAAQMSQLGTSGLGRYAAGAAGLGGAAILAGSGGDSTASPTTQAGNTPSAPAVPGAPGASAPTAAAALGQLPAGGQQGAVTRTGNSYTGPANISGDVTINGAPPRNGGQVSPQNMAAADAMGTRQAQESAARVMGQMPSGFNPNVQAPMVPNSSNDWQARKDLQNAATSAASITNNGGRFDATGGKNPAALAYQTALANDANARAAAPKLAAEAMQQTGANTRAELQQTGETQRENVRAGALTLKAQIDARKTGQAPAGYQWTPSGTLAAITGGPADPNVRGSKAPLNDVQSKALQFGTRMQTAGSTLDQLAAKGVDQPGLLKRGADAIGLGAAANWTQSGDQQQVEQSQRDFINAVLRRESGAAIADSEFANARQQYFPQPGDTPEVIALKRQNREIATSGVLAEVPDSEKRVNQVLTNAGANQPQGAAAAPASLPGGMTRQVGTSGGKPVYEDAQGRRFIGG